MEDSDCEACGKLLAQLACKAEKQDNDLDLPVLQIQDPEPARPSEAHNAFLARLQRLKEEEGMSGVVKRGRRPKTGEQKPLHEDLFEWLSKRRRGVYKNLGTKKLHFICDQKVAAIRSSTIYFILQHEAQVTHHEALLKRPKLRCQGVKLPPEDGGPGHECTQQRPSCKTCVGLCCSEEFCRKVCSWGF